jgi:hypothetical protein
MGLYERVPFELLSCVVTDRLAHSSISCLPAAGTAAAGPYEIRRLAPHSTNELQARPIIQG